MRADCVCVHSDTPGRARELAQAVATSLNPTTVRCSMARHEVRHPDPRDVLPPARPRQRPVRHRGRHGRRRATTIGLVEIMKNFQEVEAEVGGHAGRVPRRERGRGRRRAGRSRSSTTANEAGPRRQPRRDRRAGDPRRARPRARGRGRLQRRRRGGAARARWPTTRVEIGPRPRRKALPGHRRDRSRRAQAAARDAVHPGYGFLSERADFAAAVEDAGPRVRRPQARAHRADGRQGARRARRPRTPACPPSRARDGAVADVDEAATVAGEIGYPVALKAAGGGGGRGIRIVARRGRAAQGSSRGAAREAGGAFGDERALRRAVRRAGPPRRGAGARRRHPTVHLFERECSLQRRRQKVVEEAPSPRDLDETRAELCEAAVRLCGAIGYRSAGTVEFLVDDDSGEFFFIEMNTRIQVEHPVTELVDRRRPGRRAAADRRGRAAALAQDEIERAGCAIELRINAEDPDNGLHAAARARSDAVALPGRAVGARRHVARARRRGAAVLRLAARQADRLGRRPRRRARARPPRAAASSRSTGIKTTAPLLRELLDEDWFARGDFHTDARWRSGSGGDDEPRTAGAPTSTCSSSSPRR